MLFSLTFHASFIPPGIKLNDRQEIGVAGAKFHLPLCPLNDTKTLFSKENASLVLIVPMTSSYLSFRFSATKLASLLWNSSAFGAMPPVVL